MITESGTFTSYFLCSKEHEWHFVVQAASGSIPSAETSSSDVDEEKSETYSNDMTQAMGAGMFNHFMVIIQQQPSFILLRGVDYIDQPNGLEYFKLKE